MLQRLTVLQAAANDASASVNTEFAKAMIDNRRLCS